MKHLFYIAAIVVSVFVTYKITFDMTQEIVGALYIDGHVQNHKAHLKLAEAIDAGNYEKVEKISFALRTTEYDVIGILVDSLSKGSYTVFTEEEIEKGRDYLKSIETN